MIKKFEEGEILLSIDAYELEEAPSVEMITVFPNGEFRFWAREVDGSGCNAVITDDKVAEVLSKRCDPEMVEYAIPGLLEYLKENPKASPREYVRKNLK